MEKSLQFAFSVEAAGSNPVEAPKFFFFGATLQLLKLQLQLWWSHRHFICISTVHIMLFQSVNSMYSVAKRLFSLLDAVLNDIAILNKI